MRAQSPFERLKASFLASAGDVVFGMEDGTVSIFGLVFGVAATTDQRSTVLIAGASGAVAAAVSMMAGTYLDVETRRDAAKATAARMKAEVEREPAAVIERVSARFRAAGLSPDKAELAGEIALRSGEPQKRRHRARHVGGARRLARAP